MTALDVAGEVQRTLPGVTVFTGGGVDGYEVNGVRPAVVVRARDRDDVVAVLRLAAAQGLAVTARGGGTAIEQGNPPARLDVVLDLTRLNRVLEHRPQDLTVTVEAGITIDALQAELAAQGQMLALDPPRGRRATIGGVLAANAWGPRRQRYGTARDLLIGSRAVLADGSLIRAGGKVVKNVAGYDLNKLMIGSFGTLGVIVEATLKVAPLPAGFGMLLATFGSFDAAYATAMEVSRSPLQPLSLDLIGPPAAQRLVEGSRAEPAAEAWLLAMELGGSAAAVERMTRELVLIATAGGSPEVTALEPGQREQMMRRIRDYGRSADDPAALILRASVLPSDTPAVVRAIAGARGGSEPAVIVRAGSGVVYSYWGEGAAARAGEIAAALRAAAAPLGGTVVVERAPDAAMRGLDAWGLAGDDVELMRRVKAAYDPDGVLSPGRMVDRSGM